MRRWVSSPSLIALHLLGIVGVVLCCVLGWWQWEAAHSASGTLRNFGYALQWPVFGAFVIFMWWKLTRAELRPSHAPPPEEHAGGDTPGAAGGLGGAVTFARPSAANYRPPRPVTPEDQAAEAELAAYNAYLAELNARHDEKMAQDAR